MRPMRPIPEEQRCQAQTHAGKYCKRLAKVSTVDIFHDKILWVFTKRVEVVHYYCRQHDRYFDFDATDYDPVNFIKRVV